MSLPKPLTLRHLCHLLNNILGLFYHRHIVFLTISLVKNTKCSLRKFSFTSFICSCVHDKNYKFSLTRSLHGCCGANEPEASERSSSLIDAVSSQKVNFQRRFGFWSCAFRTRSCSQIFLFTITFASVCAEFYETYMIACTAYSIF